MAPTDLRRNAQRPMTHEASDMARSRSQPPVSTRDGPAAAGDQTHGRMVYPAQFGGALSIYPGLQHYQQLHLHMKDKAIRQTHQQTQMHSQGHHEATRRAMFDSTKPDVHDDEGRDTTTSEHTNRFSDQDSTDPSDTAAAQAGVSFLYGTSPNEQGPIVFTHLSPTGSGQARRTQGPEAPARAWVISAGTEVSRRKALTRAAK